jgi:hypothetical protein
MMLCDLVRREHIVSLAYDEAAHMARKLVLIDNKYKTRKDLTFDDVMESMEGWDSLCFDSYVIPEITIIKVGGTSINVRYRGNLIRGDIFVNSCLLGYSKYKELMWELIAFSGDAFTDYHNAS